MRVHAHAHTHKYSVIDVILVALVFRWNLLRSTRFFLLIGRYNAILYVVRSCVYIVILMFTPYTRLIWVTVARYWYSAYLQQCLLVLHFSIRWWNIRLRTYAPWVVEYVDDTVLWRFSQAFVINHIFSFLRSHPSTQRICHCFQVDMVTPMCSQLTYEGVIDEVVFLSNYILYVGVQFAA